MQSLKTDATNIPNILWSAKAGRYIYEDTRRFVSAQAVEAIARRRSAQIGKDIETIGELFLQRKISLAAWQEATAKSLKQLHISEYILQRGGKNAMRSEDYLEVGRSLKDQYALLRNFAEDIKRGYSLTPKGQQVQMTVGRFRARLKLYAKSGKRSGGIGKDRAERDRGVFVAEQRFLGATDRHCPSCRTYARAGIRAIGTLPRPAEDCECGSNCLCRLQRYTAADLVKMGVENFAAAVAG